MNLSEFIINDVPPVDINQPINHIQKSFNQLTYSHIPVEQNGRFIGCISENDTHCLDANKTIEEYLYTIERFFVSPHTNWLDVLEAFAQNASNIMPVLKEDKYIGYYELKDIISLFDQTPFFYEAGAVLIVQKGAKDYSFSEISQIVESNNVKLLGAFITKYDNDLVQITLKISNSGLSEIMQTFRRYSYDVIAGHEEDSYIESLKDRSEYLRKYLNI
ncbi:CBS domain-containing protein [Pseudofulvibacter geojedonensis]|uniref:CBS domain-containing protein n=1 Tax=Pseudofulvibacter geojedonensis TaxID=1123758 RepID=A0ABW3I5G9_9FLAO